LSLPGAQPRAAHFVGRAVYDVAERSWLTAFLQHWLRGSQARADDLILAQAAE
jgi:GMP synthase (glutamine-hydrolysing)